MSRTPRTAPQTTPDIDEGEFEDSTTLDLREDWQQAIAKPVVEVDQSLAGLYLVEHGMLWFSAAKRVPQGKRVKLTAEEAYHFLQMDQVNDEGQPVSEVPGYKPLVRKIANMKAMPVATP